jgi:hypothetical protein
MPEQDLHATEANHPEYKNGMGRFHRHLHDVRCRFVCFLVAAFRLPGEATSKLVLGGLDGLLVWPMKAIISYLFSPKT